MLLLAGLWFVNLVNFMDGLDWMTVAEIVPVTAAMMMLGALGELPASAALVAAALCGAMLGFAPFNRPVAKVFLGDVGSLPIGLLLGWCLLQLAWHQQFVAALLLPLYYLLRRDRDAVAPDRAAASRSGQRIAVISTSAPPTMALRCGAWSAKCSRSTLRSRRSRSDRSRPLQSAIKIRLLVIGGIATSAVMVAVFPAAREAFSSEVDAGSR